MAFWKSVDLFNADVDVSNLRIAHDSYQLVFVDGRNNNAARRVFITYDGQVVATRIGNPAPTEFIEVSALKFTDDDETGTAIPKGSVFLLCYTYVNEEEEESNPSPVTVLDTAQMFSKGYWLKDDVTYLYPISGGTYVPDNSIHGSIEYIGVDVPVSGSRIKRVNVYLAYAPYVESAIPPTNYLRIASALVLANETTKTIRLAQPQSIIPTSYENDQAPAGDDIALVDGVTFVANSVNTLGLLSKVRKMWAISLRNNNALNYINRWHRIDLHDDTVYRPDGSTYLADLDWDSETIDMANMRLYDADLTTPLEVYHYPLDATLKLTENLVIDRTLQPATVILGTLEDDNKILFSAPGVWGNDVTIQYILGALTAYVVEGGATPDPETELNLVSVAGVTPLSIEYVNPGAPSEALAVTYAADKITVSLETNGDSDLVSTYAEIKAEIEAEMEAAGALDGVLSDVSYGKFTDPDKVAAAVSEVFFTSLTQVQVVSSTDIQVLLAYDSETDAITATAADVANWVDGLLISGNRISAAVQPAPGYGAGLVEVMVAAEDFAGGTGSQPLDTDEVSTRLLCNVRIPYLPAYSEKTLYLIEFYDGTDVERAFTELVLADAGAGQMLLSDFYQDLVPINPVRSEEDIIITSPREIPLIGSNADSPNYNARSLLSNKANINYYDTENYDFVPSIDETEWLNLPDEYARAESDEVDGLRPIQFAASTQQHVIFPHEFYANAKQGTLILQTKLLESTPRDTLNEPFYIARVKFGDDRVIKLYYYPAHKAFIIWVRYPGEPGDHPSLVCPLDIAATPTVLVTIALTWDQILYGSSNSDSQLEVNLYVLHPELYQKFTFPNNKMKLIGTDTTEVRLTYWGKYAAGDPKWYYNYTQNKWQTGEEVLDAAMPYPVTAIFRQDKLDLNAISLERFARYMPVYPVSGLGAYDEFALNTAEDAAFYINTDTYMDRYYIETDNAPGRIQWGNYGAMPDLNEYNLSEEIERIVPVKSWMPTDEHNTILILTKDNVYRMALLGANAQDCRVIKELNNLGLTSKDGLVLTRTGLAWLSKDGLIIMTPDGMRYASRGQMSFDANSKLLYDYVHDWLWVRGATNTYAYQMAERTWWQFKQANFPDDFLGALNDAEGWIDYTDGVIYQFGTELSSGSYVTKIKTNAFKVVNKLGRIKLITNTFTGTYKYLVRLFGKWITGGTSVSSQYTAYNNALTSAPNAKSDYAQLEIVEADGVIAIQTEDEEGK